MIPFSFVCLCLCLCFFAFDGSSYKRAGGIKVPSDKSAISRIICTIQKAFIDLE